MALTLALVSGALAVGIVAVDLAFGLHAELRDAATGKVVSSDSTRSPATGCAGPDLTLVVDNDWIWGAKVPVSISYYDYAEARTVTVLDETWHLGAGDQRSYDFTLPDAAFEQDTVDGLRKVGQYVDVQVDGRYLNACVEATA